jgi:hypothetical protein
VRSLLCHQYILMVIKISDRVILTLYKRLFGNIPEASDESMPKMCQQPFILLVIKIVDSLYGPI